VDRGHEDRRTSKAVCAMALGERHRTPWRANGPVLADAFRTVSVDVALVADSTEVSMNALLTMGTGSNRRCPCLLQMLH